LVEAGLPQRLRWPGAGDPGVVDEDVDAVERRPAVDGGGLGGAGVGEIGLEGDTSGARLLERPGRAGAIAVDEGQGGAQPAEADGQGPTEAGGGAGQEDGAAGEPRHRSPRHRTSPGSSPASSTPKIRRRVTAVVPAVSRS